MKNKGFSLVELIVVIAIMAILVGVAVPVYTSYIGKAQKNADIQLSDEVKHAIEIGLVGDKDKPADFGGGVVVVLSGTGARVEGDDAEDKAFIEGILADTFGGSWDSDLKLKYDGWESGTATVNAQNFTDSTYSGKEEELLSQVQKLSGLLSELAQGSYADTIFGGDYQDYLDDLGYSVTSDPEAAGNAAVLYIADIMNSTLGSTVIIEETVEGSTETVDREYTVTEEFYAQAVQEAILGNGNKLITIYESESYAASAAAVYAAYEGFFQYVATQDESYRPVLTNWHEYEFDNITNLQDALADIELAYSETYGQLETLAGVEEAENLRFQYAGYTYDEEAEDIVYNAEMDASKKDALGFLSVMDAVNGSEDALLSNATSKQCFTDGQFLNLMNAYLTLGSVSVAEGQIAVVINATVNNGYSIVVFPIDY